MGNGLGWFVILFGFFNIFINARKKPSQGRNVGIYSKLSRSSYMRTGNYVTGIVLFMIGIFIILATVE